MTWDVWIRSKTYEALEKFDVLKVFMETLAVYYSVIIVE